uniref:LRAT domain-containing protein n=1 Tax=Cyprinus carpio TaxID=7962 RepID=A0A8C2EJP1_CYPCA
SAPGPESGDLIEIFRGLYQHWAVYVGEGYVIHHCTTLSKMSVPHERATVKKEKLYVVVSNNDYCINSILDEKYEPRPIQEIVQDAHICHTHTCLKNANCWTTGLFMVKYFEIIY